MAKKKERLPIYQVCNSVYWVVFDGEYKRVKLNHLNLCVMCNCLFLLYNVFIFHLSWILENKIIPDKIGNATSDTIKMKA
jgi:hypothetical protein